MAMLATAVLGCPSVVFTESPSQAEPGPGDGGPAWIGHDDDSFGWNWLMGVKALAVNDVWIVGNRLDSHELLEPVVRHYDGVAWQRVGPLEKRRTCFPNSVDALSDDDVWLSCEGQPGVGPRVEHWDGTAWQLQDIPKTGGNINDLWHVWEDTPADVWAVGRYTGDGSTGLIDHYDGRTWTQMTVPVLPGVELFGVSGTSPTDVWAVGRYEPDYPTYQPLTMHYDGTSWQVVASYDHSGRGGQGGLESVIALSPTDVWAVGGVSGDQRQRGLVLRWNGTKWVDTQADTLSRVHLTGVSALSSNDVWVVGDRFDNAPAQPAASHWDGDHWTSYQPRHPGSDEAELAAVSMAAHNSVWAVGHWRGSAGHFVRMYQYWDGTSWQRHTMP